MRYFCLSFIVYIIFMSILFAKPDTVPQSTHIADVTPDIGHTLLHTADRRAAGELTCTSENRYPGDSQLQRPHVVD